MTTDRTKFDKIRDRWLAARGRTLRYRETVLFAKHAKFEPPLSWLTKTETAKLDTLRRGEDRTVDAMQTLLAKISPRDWYNSVPIRWIMDELTFEDATTTGQLSVTPPAPYGYTQTDMARFAEPL